MEANHEGRSTLPPPLKGSSGRGVLEYALLLLLVTLVIIAVLRAYGQSLNSNWYQPLDSAVTDAGK